MGRGWMGWMGWMVAVFGQRLCKGPSEQHQPWKFWKAQADGLEGPCWCPTWMACVSFPAFPPAPKPPSQAAQRQPCQQAPLFWALIQPLTPVSKHSATCEVCSSALLLTDNVRDAGSLFLGKFQSPFLFQTALQLCRVSFSLWRSHGCRQEQAEHLHAPTNPVYHLLCFYFLSNCKFLNLGLDWKTGSASFFLHEPTAAGMDGLPATPAENSPLRPSCSFPSVITAHHGTVTPAGCTSEFSQVQVHPADTEFNSDFWKHTCTWQ